MAVAKGMPSTLSSLLDIQSATYKRARLSRVVIDPGTAIGPTPRLYPKHPADRYRMRDRGHTILTSPLREGPIHIGLEYFIPEATGMNTRTFRPLLQSHLRMSTLSLRSHKIIAGGSPLKIARRVLHKRT